MGVVAMVEYYSAHAKFFNDYIDFKRSFGYQFEVEYVFKGFDTFLVENNFEEIGLTRTICDLWGVIRPNEAEKNRYRRVNTVRNYAMYLNRIGYPSYIPRQTKNPRQIFTPHIFTKEEIVSFFSACDAAPITKESKTTHVYPALFRLVYGCGLRINEALSLKIGDVDFLNNFLVVRGSKNGEDRILPFSESVAEALSAYKKKWKLDTSEDALFFTDRFGGKCSSDAAYRRFREVLFRAGISHGGKGIGPRVHDFRHSFSVHVLAAMAEAGLDLYYCLPILSKYLGHKSLSATEQYVRLTEDMYPGIMEEMNKLCPCLFPEASS
jgi:integrase